LAHAAFAPAARVRHERVGERLRALVRERIGIDGRSHEAEAQHIIAGAMAVFGVVEQREAEAGLADIEKTMRDRLEHRGVPRRVDMGRPLDDAIGAFVGRDARADSGGRQRA
jgi:hypothetical protein